MKPRLMEVDLLRSIACISVIFTHVTATVLALGIAPPSAYWPLVALNRFCIFNVPMFIFISGLVLYYRYQNQPLPVFSFWQKRIQTTYLPYVIWSLLYFLLYYLKGSYGWDPRFLGFAIVRGTMVYHLYFVIIIMQFYLLFPLIKEAFDRWNSWLVLTLALVATLAGFALSEYGWKLAWPAYWLDRHFLSYLFYFCLGCFWAKKQEVLARLKQPVASLLFMIGLQTGLKVGVLSMLYTHPTHPWNGHYQLLWLLFSSGDLILLTLAAQRWGARRTTMQERMIGFIGKHSYSVYLCHPLFLMLAQRLTSDLAIQEAWTLFGLLLLVTLCGAFFTAEVLDRLNLSLRRLKQ